MAEGLCFALCYTLICLSFKLNWRSSKYLVKLEPAIIGHIQQKVAQGPGRILETWTRQCIVHSVHHLPSQCMSYPTNESPVQRAHHHLLSIDKYVWGGVRRPLLFHIHRGLLCNDHPHVNPIISDCQSGHSTLEMVQRDRSGATASSLEWDLSTIIRLSILNPRRPTQYETTPSPHPRALNRR